MEEVSAYLEQVPQDRRADVVRTYELIKDWHPDLEVKMWGSMGAAIIGFGAAAYKYKSGREGKWFIIGLSARKRYNSLYIWGFEDGRYLLEAYGDKLGRVKYGKCCLNFKTLADLDLSVLREVVDLAVGQASADT